jgi:hypothetical protein
LAVEMKEYSSFTQIAETMDREISETKSALGEYLRRLDEIRDVAEKSKKVREVVMKLAGKRDTAATSNEITVGTLVIVLDATPSHELASIETAVRSHQEHLLDLQKAREGLKSLGNLGDTEGIQLLAVENNGIPERILFKLS